MKTAATKDNRHRLLPNFAAMAFGSPKVSPTVALLAFNLMGVFRPAVLRACVLKSGNHGVRHTLKIPCYEPFPKPKPPRP